MTEGLNKQYYFLYLDKKCVCLKKPKIESELYGSILVRQSTHQKYEERAVEISREGRDPGRNFRPTRRDGMGPSSQFSIF